MLHRRTNSGWVAGLRSRTLALLLLLPPLQSFACSPPLCIIMHAHAMLRQAQAQGAINQ
jgi:hypothetical protein